MGVLLAGDPSSYINKKYDISKEKKNQKNTKKGIYSISSQFHT